jgi:hypothetical protein
VGVGSGGGGTAGVWTSHTRTSGAGRPHPCLSPPQNHPHPNHEFVDTVRGAGKKLTTLDVRFIFQEKQLHIKVLVISWYHLPVVI